MTHFKRSLMLSLVSLLAYSLLTAQPSASPKTYCNPMNLSYRFMVDAVDAREAADPVVVLFKDTYYLFASRSGGYWWSNDLRSWTFVVPTGLTIIEDYAPALVVMRDTLFYTGSNDGQVFKSADPKTGRWAAVGSNKSYGDPDLFLDDDGKLYMYYGLSNVTPTAVVELDPYTFAEIGSPVTFFATHASSYGWERRGDDNLLDEQPWIEGSWMVKRNGKYYLHYSAPGTEFKTYADGIYVADSPKGPFQYADYSPFSFKPTGFIAGAGHGCTFKDKNGNYWRVVTMTISVKHMFERRLGLFPVSFDNDGEIYCRTDFADYPQYLPGEKSDPGTDNRTGMMLLSRKKYVTASSSLQNHGVKNAVDEEVRSYWSAQTGNPDEWLMIDLGKECDIEAVQINFAEEGTTPELVRGRTNPVYEQYVLEMSNDGENWTTLVDKSGNTIDVPHDYIELAQAANARFVKLRNVSTPGNGKFAVRDLRIFGNSSKAVFQDITDFTVNRNAADGRDATISWPAVNSADGYVVRYGIAPDKLYNSYLVYDADSVAIHSLNKNVQYYFSVQSFDGGTDSYDSTGEYKSFKSGNWNDPDTWQKFGASGWTHPAPEIPAAAAGPVTISAGHTVTLASSDSASRLSLDSGSTLVINPGITLTVTNNPGTDLTVGGTVLNKGILEAAPSALISFVDGGKYIHDQDGGPIPSAQWRSGSTCSIEGVVANTPSNANQNFHNVVWNCRNQTAILSPHWNGNVIGGRLTVSSTGTGRLFLCAPPSDSSVTVAIRGGVSLAGGSLSSNETNNGGTSITITLNGSLTITGGTFSISRGAQGGTGTSVWAVDGNVSVSGATIQNSNPSGGRILLTGTHSDTLTLGTGNTLTALPIEVDSGTVVNLGASELGGSGGFVVNPGATVYSGHTEGLNGNLKNTGAITLSSKGGYGFNGTAAQGTGTLLPDTVGKLIVNNGAGITLSKSVTVGDMLDIRTAGFATGNAMIHYGRGAALRYAGTAAMTTGDAEFPAEGGPDNVIIDNTNTSGVTLHSQRTISGNLRLSGRFRLAGYDFTAASVSSDTITGFVVTNGTGSLVIPNVGPTEALFPLGTFSYTPVWIANTGTADAVSARVESASQTLANGGRVRVKWTLSEGTAGEGLYTIRFGWMPSLEDGKFRLDRQSNAGIFLLGSDTTEAGTGAYTTQFDAQPYTVSRGGITALGAFGVGKFGNITSAIGNQKSQIPDAFTLNQNYPNPFNPSTTITYSIPKNSYVTLKVYNLLGQVVTTLCDGLKPAGNYAVTFDGSRFASGVYLYRLKANNLEETRKLVLIK